jgi:hypothetical protein
VLPTSDTAKPGPSNLWLFSGTIRLNVPSHPSLSPHTLAVPCLTQHEESEYGAAVGPDGRHSGGPFTMSVSPKMRIEELRLVIRV